MRIISGKYKGRQIQAPANLPVRPTTDFAKTGLFNILESRFDIENSECLDLYSGTGSISLELVSRGAISVTAVDRESVCVRFLQSVIKKLVIPNLEVVRSDVTVFLRWNKKPYDIIFADAPFESKDKPELIQTILTGQHLKQEGVLIVEHATDDDYSVLKGFDFARSYGNVTFSFFCTFSDPK